MNKAVGYGVGVVVIIVLVVGFMVMRPKTTQAPSVAGNPSGSEGAQQGQGEKGGTLKDLFAMTTSQTCTFTNADGTSATGTVYVSGGKVRSDFSTSASEEAGQAMHMIVKDQTSYLWGDALQGKGVKMAFADMEAPADTTKPSSQQSASLNTNQSVKYSCKPWAVDASVFELPTGVEFSDFGAAMQAQMKAAQEGGVMSSTSAQCAQCAALSGDAQAQCKAALQCK